MEATFRRAADIAVGTRRRRNKSIALFGLAYALINQARWDEAAMCLDESLDLARTAGRPADLANALRGTAALRGMRGDLDSARPFLDQAASLLPRLRPKTASAVWLDIGWHASQRDMLDEARRGWITSRDLASGGGARLQLARVARLNLAWADLLNGSRPQGRAAVEALVAEARAARDLNVLSHGLTTLAAADWEDGDDAAARVRAVESLELLARRGVRVHAGEANGILGLVEVRAGNVAAAEERLALAAPLVVTRQGRSNCAELLLRLGDAAAREGRTADARVRYERAAAILDRWGSPARAAGARAALARLPGVGGPG
jgi:tetratricopeptide (TPR) repeat protein